MWEYTFVTTTDTPIDPLWSAALNVLFQEDRNLMEGTIQPGSLRQSVRFRGCNHECLMTVDEIDPPCRLVLVRSVFLATIRTECEFHTTPSGTQIDIAVQLHGPLGWFYRSSLASQLNRELPSMVREFVVQARTGNSGTTQGPYGTLIAGPAISKVNASTINR